MVDVARGVCMLKKKLVHIYLFFDPSTYPGIPSLFVYMENILPDVVSATRLK